MCNTGSSTGVRTKLLRLRMAVKQTLGGEQEQGSEGSLEQCSRKLVIREEHLFGKSSPSEEDQNVLQEEIQKLKVQILDVLRDQFLSAFLASSSVQLQAVSSCISAVLLQEDQDKLWTTRSHRHVPAWRPLKCLSAHNSVIRSLLEDRLDQAERQVDREQEIDFRRLVMRLGHQMQEDLVVVAMMLKEAYHPYMDILNICARLYHVSLRGRITALTSAGLEEEHNTYLLYWVKERYTQDVLGHPDLNGQVNTSCLDSLLLPDHLTRLEERYLSNKKHRLSLWLDAALQKEEESWFSQASPEVLDGFLFSPLAVDVIQMIDSCLEELRRVVRDQTHTQHFLFYLENFLCSYLRCVEKLLKSNHSNTHSVIKAQLVCEQQLRDYVSGPGMCLSLEYRRHCEETLSVVKDKIYTFLTSSLQRQLKACLHPVWTSVWVDGSRPVVDSVLESVSRQLTELTDLKPSCRQSLLGILYEDIVLLYVRKTLDVSMKSREQQVGGAYRLIQDAQMIDSYFAEEGSSEVCRFSSVLFIIAEFLRHQETDNITSELINLRCCCPDLSDAHVSILLALKINLSPADVRSIRKSLAETRQPDEAANHKPPFFSRLKVGWKQHKLVKLVKQKH